jgi:DNA-binding transcriptional MerR regulator
MAELAPDKLYYSISEVSGYIGVEQHVLRYWETEFPKLRPKKNRAGNRAYRLKDIKLLLLIKKLLYEEKYTIEGARQKLKQSDSMMSAQMELVLEDSSYKNVISGVKKELQQLLDLLKK